MIFLCSSISSSKSIFVISRDHFAKLQALIAPAGHLHRFLDASELAGCSFPLYCISHRTSPCLGRSRLVCLACRWLCSCLGCCWLCSCLACCWLCSSRFLSSSLHMFVFFSLSSYPCCFTSSFSPQARWLWFCLGFSPLAPWLWFLLCFFSESLRGKLRLIVSVLASFQHHYSALRPS